MELFKAPTSSSSSFCSGWTRSVFFHRGRSLVGWEGLEREGLTCGWKKTMAMACLVLLVRTVSCFQWPSYVSGLYTEYGVVLHPNTHTHGSLILKVAN